MATIARSQLWTESGTGAAAKGRRPGALRGDGGLTQGRDGRPIGRVR
jgi:hypothetical protein